MTTKRKNFKLIFTFFVSLNIMMLLGCDISNKGTNSEKSLNLKSDENLTKKSGHAGVIYTSMHIQKDLNCLAAEKASLLSINKSGGNSPEGEKIKKIFQESVSRFSSICEFYEKVIIETTPVFEMLKQEGHFKDELYNFFIFLPDDDDNDFTKREEEIGLFSSLEVCEKLEATVRELNIPTIKCNPWQEEFL